MKPARNPAKTISAVVSDVDGTLVTNDKTLTPRAAASVSRLRDNGIKFAIVSSRPPRGLRSVIEQLKIATPVAGFNGGVVATPALVTITRHLIAPAVARHAVEMIEAAKAHAWVFSGEEWFVLERDAPHVAHEERTVGFGPTVVDDFASALDTAAKIVAVSEEPGLLTKLNKKVRAAIGDEANIVQSQAYYLDLTHPLANKGEALRELAKAMSVPVSEVAVLGDGDNDVDMFSPSGLSIAMGNASETVRKAADFVTASNSDDGFAKAVDWFVLGDNRTAIPTLEAQAAPEGSSRAAGARLAQ